MTIRTAKYVTGNFVPVVGGLFAEAADTVVGASLLVKNAVHVRGHHSHVYLRLPSTEDFSFGLDLQFHRGRHATAGRQSDYSVPRHDRKRTDHHIRGHGDRRAHVFYRCDNHCRSWERVRHVAVGRGGRVLLGIVDSTTRVNRHFGDVH